MYMCVCVYNMYKHLYLFRTREALVTIESWGGIFTQAGFRICSLLFPSHPVVEDWDQAMSRLSL